MPDEQYILAGSALGVRFFAAGDRFAHIISLRNREQSQVFFESVEGGPDDAWPSSPPLQSVIIEKPSASRRLAMLLGMAGQSHWSLAVELLTSADGEWLIFDFACRAPQPPEFVGSRYRFGPLVRWNKEEWPMMPSGQVRLRTDDYTALLRPHGSPNEMVMIPRTAQGSIAFPATLRWKYSIEVAT